MRRFVEAVVRALAPWVLSGIAFATYTVLHPYTDLPSSLTRYVIIWLVGFAIDAWITLRAQEKWAAATLERLEAQREQWRAEDARLHERLAAEREEARRAQYEKWSKPYDGGADS